MDTSIAPNGVTPEQATAEMRQIQSDRASGKISDAQWRTQYEGRVRELGSAAYAPPPVRLPAPIPAPSSKAPPSDAHLAREEISDIQRRRANGEISDYAWREEYEPKIQRLGGVAQDITAYEQADSGTKNAIRASWDADRTQELFEQSIDAEPAARTPWEYNLPEPDEPVSEADAAAVVPLDRAFREGLYRAGAPAELGTHLGQSVLDTARQLRKAGSVEEQAKLVEQNTEQLRAAWGSQYEQKLGAVVSLLRSAPAELQQFAHEHPELLSSVTSMNYLLRLARRTRK